MSKILSVLATLSISAWLFGAPALFGESGSPSGDGDRELRLTPEERRERWQQLRAGSEAERRERLQDMGRGLEVRQPNGPRPNDYLEQLQFRSILTVGGVTQFSLRNEFENRSFIVSEEEGRYGIEVVRFDRKTEELTLRHETGQERTLRLEPARVIADDEFEEDWSWERRRIVWQERREQYDQFRVIWEEAAEGSPELREIQRQFEELGVAFRDSFRALRETDPNTDDHRLLREAHQALRDEFALVMEYALMEARKHPSFEEEDPEFLERMLRGLSRVEGSRGWGRRERW